MSFVIIHMVFKNKYVFPSSVFNLYTREGTYFFAHQYKFHLRFSAGPPLLGGAERSSFREPEPALVAHDL